MIDQDKEHLRDLTAMFAMNGIIAGGELHFELMSEDAIAKRSYEMADAMLEAREQKNVGIKAMRKRKLVK